MSNEVLCIGSVLWDIIGRSASHMQAGHDGPGRIERRPGGVALNIALTLTKFGLRPVLLSALGDDRNGVELSEACADLGCDVGLLTIAQGKPTDRYMAIEAAGGLVAAIADAHTLEEAGASILMPLQDARLGTQAAPYGGRIILDGNLTEALLSTIAHSPLFRAAHLAVAPASPGKAHRIAPFVRAGRGTLYVNLFEARTLLGCEVASAPDAAQALVAAGAERVLVTNGADLCADADRSGCVTARPPSVTVHQVTGAGDTFLASHIAAELSGAPRDAALNAALDAAARFVSGEAL